MPRCDSSVKAAAISERLCPKSYDPALKSTRLPRCPEIRTTTMTSYRSQRAHYAELRNTPEFEPTNWRFRSLTIHLQVESLKARTENGSCAVPACCCKQQQLAVRRVGHAMHTDELCLTLPAICRWAERASQRPRKKKDKRWVWSHGAAQ